MEYNIEVSAEAIDRYCPGGYHPVRIGDRFKDGQYQIVQKLGFGSFSTVWLARDVVNNRNVAVKIVVAEKSTELNRELRILRHLDFSRRDHPGRDHVLNFLDSFYHDGPNGRHLCIVLDVLGPKISTVAESYKNYRIDGHLARQMSLQLLLAVAYIHSSGVAHGDIHPGNVIFRCTELSHLTPQEMSDRYGPPKIGEVTRCDGKPLEKGVPDYLVEPMERKIEELQNLRDVLLIDFGEAFLVHEPPKKVNTLLSFHSPEVVFRHGITKAVDLWNLGCTIYKLVTGCSLFELSGFDDRVLLPQFTKLLGKMPDHWIADALDCGALDERPRGEDAKEFRPLEAELRKSYRSDYEQGDLELDDQDLANLATSLQRMLVAAPEKRVDAEDLLNDPWFVPKGINNGCRSIGLKL